MDINILKETLQKAGITGAGGAGFPAYAKLNTTADTLILNCAECEPLLKLHRQLLEEDADTILSALSEICKITGIKEFVIGIKHSYKNALESVNAEIGSYKNARVHILDEIYPSGDEVVLTYNVTKRIVPPGGIPIDVGVVVYNVETVLNIYNALNENKGVTHKYVTVAGEVKNPLTLKVPIGTKFSQLLEISGGKTIEDTAIIQGGPMTGKLSSESQTVSKTTNAVLVLPKEHCLISNRTRKTTISIKQAMSTCCQCKTCTEMCPRNLLGHPISPSDFMKSLTSLNADTNALLNTMYCSQCGVCEAYACPQGLSPATLIGIYKDGLRKNSIRPQKLEAPKSVRPEREYRQLPMYRLENRLDVLQYDKPAPLSDITIKPKKVKIALSQSIGAPSVPCIKKGDKVNAGDMIATPAENALSIALHASIDGVVTDVTDSFIVISSK